MGSQNGGPASSSTCPKAWVREGSISGLWVGLVVGFWLASQVLAKNPGIEDARDKLVTYIFICALYGVLSVLVGIAAATIASLLPVSSIHRRANCLLGSRAFWTGIIATVFLIADGLGECWECHMWHRGKFPSLEVSVGQSLLNTLVVAGRSILVGLAIGFAAHLLGRLAKVGVRPWIPRPIVTISALTAIAIVLGSVLATNSPKYYPPRYQDEMIKGQSARVHLIVVDGADWAFINPLMKSGHMPHLRKLVEAGASGPLAVSRPCISPRLWTCLSTGVDETVHGLCDFLNCRLPGMRAPITNYPGGLGFSKRFLLRALLLRLARLGIVDIEWPSSLQKRAPDVWDYLGQAGKLVLVSGWRYTYPASQVNGVLVSDRFVWQSRFPRSVYPPSIESHLNTEMGDQSMASMSRLVNHRLHGDSLRSAIKSSKRMNTLNRSISSDLVFASLTTEISKKLDPDFCAVGLTAVDEAEHLFMLENVLSRKSDINGLSRYFKRFTDQDKIQLYSDIIQQTYAITDSLLGEIIAHAADDLVIVASDHGHDQDGTGHRYSPDGVFVLSGPPVRNNARLTNASIYDVAPTILYAMGLPVPAGMEGRVLEEAFHEEWLTNNPIRLTPEDTHREPTEVTEEALERLKALGYIE